MLANPVDYLTNPVKRVGVYLGPDIWVFEDQLTKAFSWMTRVGAGRHFPGIPIGWYQQHQVAAIDELRTLSHKLVGATERPDYFRVKEGQFQVFDESTQRWKWTGLTPRALFKIVDQKIRREFAPYPDPRISGGT